MERIAIEKAHRLCIGEGSIAEPLRQDGGVKVLQGKDFTYDTLTGRVLRKGRVYKWIDSNLQERIESTLAFLATKVVMRTVPGKCNMVQLYTEFHAHRAPIDGQADSLRGRLYRAHPRFCSAGKKAFPWHDWVYGNYGTDGLIPCHICTFVDILSEQDGVRFGTFLVGGPNGTTIDKPGYHALCEGLEAQLSDGQGQVVAQNRDPPDPESRKSYDELMQGMASNESRLVFKARKAGVVEIAQGQYSAPMIFALPLESAAQPCIAVPDIPTTALQRDQILEGSIFNGGTHLIAEERTGEYLFLRPRSEWPRIFMEELWFSGVEPPNHRHKRTIVEDASDDSSESDEL